MPVHQTTSSSRSRSEATAAGKDAAVGGKKRALAESNVRRCRGRCGLEY
jgi:hypothetical protein